jgi:hypothetical protein
MTDYNDGKWHGWNGGECPVHPKSVIEAYYFPHGHIGPPWHFEGVAAGKKWELPFLFRVVKEFREPREMVATWSAGRGCFEIHVANINIPHRTPMTVTGVLP